MIFVNIENKKHFMRQLLKETAFDRLLARSIVLRTAVLYEIDCTLDKDSFDTDEVTEKYASWEYMRPIIYSLLKGSRLPGYMKIILSPTPVSTEKIHTNAASLFINIIFENNTLTVSTGCSEKVFSMDKSVENTWDEYIYGFLKRHEIVILK